MEAIDRWMMEQVSNSWLGAQPMWCLNRAQHRSSSCTTATTSFSSTVTADGRRRARQLRSRLAHVDLPSQSKAAAALGTSCFSLYDQMSPPGLKRRSQRRPANWPLRWRCRVLHGLAARLRSPFPDSLFASRGGPPWPDGCLACRLWRLARQAAEGLRRYESRDPGRHRLTVGPQPSRAVARPHGRCVQADWSRELQAAKIPATFPGPGAIGPSNPSGPVIFSGGHWHRQYVYGHLQG